MRRNSLLRSRKPLRRKTRIRQRRATPRRSGRVRDREYLLAVKGLPCLMTGYGGACDGPVEADHAGRRPLGRKCSDDEAIPLCRRHHRDRTDGTGWFKGLAQGFVRGWCDAGIAVTRARLRGAS